MLSSFDLEEAFLAHYGVKGMHWGIRKDHTEEHKRQTPNQKDEPLPLMKTPIKRLKETYRRDSLGVGLFFATAILGSAGLIAINELSYRRNKFDWGSINRHIANKHIK